MATLEADATVKHIIRVKEKALALAKQLSECDQTFVFCVIRELETIFKVKA